MRVVVVGASLAGVRTGEALRREGFTGSLTIVGEETHQPYDRPPLSKQVLAGTRPPDDALLRIGDDIAGDLRLGVRATALDLDDRCVTLDTGERLAFDAVVVATGATPRRLSGTPDLTGVHTLRTLDDCVVLSAELATASRVAVIGAGFIGSEVASTCRERGLDVTVIEAMPTPLSRVLGERMGTVFGELHRANGTDLRLGVGVAGLEGDGHVERVRLADGTAVDADVVVVGIGVAPVTDWLEGSGLELRDGVVCDARLRAAEGVYAVGDVARWPHALFEEEMRIEHWTNAVEMGDFVGQQIARGTPSGAYAPVPYFWSDQYGKKIQFVGIAGDDEPVVVEGATDDFKFVATYSRAGRLVGALSIGMPRQIMNYRRLIADGG